MDFKDLVKSRRSCRSFENEPVSEEQIRAILDAGRWAPSPLNLQPWEFVVITDSEAKARIRKAADSAKQEVVDKGGPDWVAKYGMGFLEEAPVLVAVLVDPGKKGLGDYFGQTHGAFQAASACIQNMILSAAEMGLGSVWFTFFRPETLHAALGIPEHLEIAAVIPFGKPKGEVKAPPRKDARTHYQQYTASK